MVTRELTTIDFGLGPKQLRYSITATRRIKEKYGSLKDLSEHEPFDTLPELIYAGLVDRSDVTPEQIADLIDFADVGKFYKIFAKAFTGMNQDAITDADMEKNEPTVTTGSPPLTLIGSGASDTAS